MTRSVPTAGNLTPVGRAVLAVGLAFAVQTAWSQQPLPKHLRYSSDWPPGAIGRLQLERGGPLAGYFQPVEVTAPKGTLVSASDGNPFGDQTTNIVRAGMQIGYAYRLRVGNIPLREGQEVFPTIEVINRLYPPPGAETQFPIPIQLTAEELQMACDGRFVTRVIYLEDPQGALPVQDEPGKQRYFEVGRLDDPLEIADRMGRPMAVLRMGSRIPAAQPDPGDHYFPAEQPPNLPFEKAAAMARRNGLEEPIDPRSLVQRPRTLPPVQPAVNAGLEDRQPEVRRTSVSQRLRPIQDPGPIRR